MTPSSPGSKPEAETHRQARRQPVSAFLTPGPRYRWASSSVAQARSLHLILCLGGLGCSQSRPSLSADTFEEDLPVDLTRITGENAISPEREPR